MFDAISYLAGGEFLSLKQNHCRIIAFDYNNRI